MQDRAGMMQVSDAHTAAGSLALNIHTNSINTAIPFDWTYS